ncbi:MAG TPA: hypothetical protein VIM61_02015 [Chthoniobacterales bacterium]
MRASQLLSIPRSIGEIYGLLYASPQPISMDAIMERLAMSKGSVSQGLRWLREIGAVRSTYFPGDRRDHFLAETELRKLAAGFLRERIGPHLRSAEDNLGRLTETAAKIGDGDKEFVADRLAKMQTWYRLSNQVLPFFLQATGKF